MPTATLASYHHATQRTSFSWLNWTPVLGMLALASSRLYPRQTSQDARILAWLTAHASLYSLTKRQAIASFSTR